MKQSNDFTDSIKENTIHTQIDVFTLNNADFQSITDHNRLHLLQPLPTNPDVYPFTEDAFVHDEVLYARPLVFSPIVLAYNRAHFRDAAVPEPDSSWTWDDCLHYAAALTEPGIRHGFYFYLLSDNRWPAFLLQSGMNFEFEQDESFQLAGTRLLESMRLSKRIISDPTIYPRYMSENSEDVTALFLQGKVSMIMTNYMTINEFKATELDYDISPLPYLYEPRSLMNVIGVAINNESKNKETAQLLTDFLHSSRAQQIIREQTLSLPSRRDAAVMQTAPRVGMNRPSRYSLFREIMSSYKLHQELKLSTASFTALRQILKKYWSGLIDDDALCMQVDEMVRRLGKSGESPNKL